MQDSSNMSILIKLIDLKNPEYINESKRFISTDYII